MPPRQCPACGRFLSNAFVIALREQAQPCPGCEETLDDTTFADDIVAQAADAPSGVSSDGSPGAPAHDSVGAPADDPAGDDTDDAAKAGADVDDVLDGWDTDTDAARASLVAPPFPTDTAWMAAGAGAGALFGALVALRRVRGALVGGLLGALIVAALRRVWRLED